VPGGLPFHTYVQQNGARQENSLRRAANCSRKLVTATGATKTGKTVLTKTVFPQADVVWLDGGEFANEDEVWGEALRQLDAFTDYAVEDGKPTRSDVSGEVEAGVGLGPLARLRAQAGARKSQGKTDSVSRGRRDAPTPTALSALREAHGALIIDDFHDPPQHVSTPSASRRSRRKSPTLSRPTAVNKATLKPNRRTLRHADQGDFGPLGEFLARAILDNLYRFVVPAIAGPARLLPLPALATPDLSANALRVAAIRGRLKAAKVAAGTWRSSPAWVDEDAAERYKRN